MAGSSSSWSAPSFGSAMGSSSSWSAPTFGSAMGSSSAWFAPSFGSAMGSSSVWSAPSFGSARDSSSAWSASGFGRPTGLFSSSPAHSIWGSPAPSSPMPFGTTRGTYSWTSPAFGVSSTQPSPFGSSCSMPVYKSKSHEELRHEDYQRGDKGY